MKNLHRQQKASCLLDLTRQPVGIKLFFTEEAFDACEFSIPRAKLPYCVAVRMASDGFCWKAKLDKCGCMGGARALGLVSPDEGYLSGRMFDALGLYADLDTAKATAGAMTLIPKKAMGFAAAPLKDYTDSEPDVVIFICGAYTSMRIVQGYTHQFATNTEYRFSGNQAICSECTAYPFLRGKLNLSTLCSGTRIKAGWKEHELALGLPFSQIDALLNGVEATVNLMDDDAHKQRIAHQLQTCTQCTLKPEDIVYHHNYFTGLFQRDKQIFAKDVSEI